MAIVWQGENLERAAFFIEHASSDWSSTLVELLQKTATLAMSWQTRGDAVTEISVSVKSDDVNSAFKDGIPSGLREINWIVRADQAYGSGMLSEGSGAERW